MDTLTIQDQDQNEDLYLMSNVQPAESGLPFLAYISERQGQHDVRVKFARKAPNWVAAVTVRPTVDVVVGRLSKRDLDLVRRWIEMNKDVIIAHWEGKMPSSRDVLNALKPLPKA